LLNKQFWNLAAFAVAATFTFATILAFATVAVAAAFAATFTFAVILAFAVMFAGVTARRVGAGRGILGVGFGRHATSHQSGDGRCDQECSLCSAHVFISFGFC